MSSTTRWDPGPLVDGIRRLYRSDIETATEPYKTLIKALGGLLLKESNGQINLTNYVQYGTDNEMVINEAVNTDVLAGIQELLTLYKTIQEDNATERSKLEMKQRHNEALLKEMSRKLDDLKAMTAQINTNEESAVKKLAQLTEMVESLSFDPPDADVMLDLVKYLKGLGSDKMNIEFATMPFKAQQGIQRIVGKFGNPFEWQSLARGLGMDPTQISRCDTGNEWLDTQSCTRVIQNWLQMTPGESCQLVKTLVNLLHGFEEDMMKDLKEKYSTVHTATSPHQDTTGAVSASSLESTNVSTRQHTEDHLNTAGRTREIIQHSAAHIALILEKVTVIENKIERMPMVDKDDDERRAISRATSTHGTIEITEESENCSTHL